MNGSKTCCVSSMYAHVYVSLYDDLNCSWYIQILSNSWEATHPIMIRDILEEFVVCLTECILCFNAQSSRNLYFDFLFRYLFYASIYSSLTLNLILLYYWRRFRPTWKQCPISWYYSILRYNSIITYHICYKCKFVYINLQIQLYGMFMSILETYIKTFLEILRIKFQINKCTIFSG